MSPILNDNVLTYFFPCATFAWNRFLLVELICPETDLCQCWWPILSTYWSRPEHPTFNEMWTTCSSFKGRGRKKLFLKPSLYKGWLHSVHIKGGCQRSWVGCLLALTGALTVMMVYYIGSHFFRFSLSQLMQLMFTSVTLSRLNSINAIDVTRC